MTFLPPTATPNQALQRTAPCVTAPASAATFPPTMQVPRRTPLSLSLGSLGDFAHLIRAISALEDIRSPMPSTKTHALKTSSCESIASSTVWPSVALCLFRSRRFQSSQASAAREFDSTFARRLSRGGCVHTLHAQQLRASRQRGGFGLSSIACASPSPSFPGIHARASIASPGVAPGTLVCASVPTQ